jgi:hypothetical protein
MAKNIHILRILTALPVIVGQTSCGLPKEKLSEILDATLPSPAQQSQAVLGKGYNTKEERFAGDCVNGTTEFAGAPESSVNFERSLSATETANSLGFAVGGKARYNSIQGSASAKFASDSSSNDYSEATIYSAEYRFKNAKLKYSGLTEVGKKASQGNGRFVWENWEKTCGHEFVEQIRLGAKLLISAKVEFSTKEDKKAFSAEFKIKGPAFAASGELSKASRRFGKSASVSVRAYQLGGDVSRLSSIFGQGSNARVDSDGKQLHALLVCSMDRIDACMRVLDSALSYATDTSEPTSFPNQVRPTYDPARPDGPAELAYITKPWSDLAFYPPPPVIAEGVRIARADLSQIFEEQLKKRNRISALVSGPFRLSPRQSANVDSASILLSENMSEIADGASVCYSDVEKCVSRVIEVKKNLKQIDDTLLDVYPDSFAQWCDSLDNEIIRSSAQGTVAALMNIANRELDLGKVADKCSTAQNVLSDLQEIDLSEKNIENLTPLSSLKNLRKLNLNRNKISDAGPISGLTGLRELALNTNKLEDISSLAKLTGLQTLMLSANKIERINDISALNRLETLWLGENKIEDINPLQNLSNLRILKLGNNRIRTISPLASLKKLESVDLSRNSVTDPSVLLTLPLLQSIDLSDNPSECPSLLSPICTAPL